MIQFENLKLKEMVLDGYFDDEIVKYKFNEIEERYLVIIFYPLDFTFVCPTELKKFSDLKSQFDDLSTTLVFCSGDSVYSHKAWSGKSREDGGVGKLNFPMLSDKNFELSKKLQVFNEAAGHVMRATVIYDMENDIIKHLSVNADSIGRSSEEILRLIKACQFNEKYGEICPVDFNNDN